MEEIMRQAIEAVLKKMMINGIISGTVADVTDTTCTVKQDGRPDIENVSLNAYTEVEGSYFTAVPKEGSIVQVAVIDGIEHNGFVLKCTEVDKVIWKCGDKSFAFDAKEMVIHEGKNGGVPIAKNVADRLNTLENGLTALTKLYDTHTHVIPLYATIPGTMPVPPTTMISGQTYTPTQPSDIENEKVKH